MESAHCSCHHSETTEAVRTFCGTLEIVALQNGYTMMHMSCQRWSLMCS